MKKILEFIRKNIYIIFFTASISIIFNIIVNITGVASLDKSFQEANEKLSAFGTYGMLFLVFIFAPIVEELIFRKLIFKISRKYFRFTIAALISAFLFGIVHLNITQFIYAFIVGYILCYAYELTGTIITPILAHGLSNIFVVIIYGAIVGKNMSFMNKIFIIIILIAIALMSWYRWHEINNIKFVDIIKRK